MRRAGLSTSVFASAGFALLTGCGPQQKPAAPPAPPTRAASVPPYCSAEICADAANIAESHLERGPDFVVHRFTMRDGSTAGVYVGGYPQAPPAGTPSTVELIDGVACERFDINSDKPEVQIYCQWKKDFPTAIHAFANAPSNPKASQALALLLSLRRCDAKTECPWPQQ